MIKQIFLAFLLYSVIWWVLFTIHFDYINKNENKNYKRDGINGYAISLLYFLLFTVIYVIIQTLLENDDNVLVKDETYQEYETSDNIEANEENIDNEAQVEE